jgi:general L-amino acid transport system substrate-binding protein
LPGLHDRCVQPGVDSRQGGAEARRLCDPARSDLKEPLGPAVRRGDDEWFAIVKWLVFALIEAEELGITQANADSLRNSPNPAVQRLLGSGDDSGRLLGLDREWALRAIKAVGNYGEIFERNLGSGSSLKLPRGSNALWTKGGLMYAPPVR